MAFGDTETHEDNPIMATDSISEIIEKTTQNNIQSLHDSRHLIDNKTIEVTQAVPFDFCCFFCECE